VIPLFQVKFLEGVFENEISRADCVGWSVSAADCCGTGIGSVTLRSALMKNSQKEGGVEQNLKHLVANVVEVVSDEAFIALLDLGLTLS
jgi:hypothetical protein